MNQNQKAGNESLNLQAGGSISITSGLTYTEAKDLFLSLFKENFYQLQAEARTIAESRAEEITSKFLERLEAENPEGLQQAKDPDFQYALITAQKEFVRSGDERLEEVLVDLLVERSKQNLIRIVLNESLEVVPKLTEGQINVLTLAFILKYTCSSHIVDKISFKKYFSETLVPFLENIPTKSSSYQHLEFTGCGSLSLGMASLYDIFSTHYVGLFSKGFEQNIADEVILKNNQASKMFIRCLHNNQLLQISMLNEDRLRTHAVEWTLDNEVTEQLVSLQKSSVMDQNEIFEVINSWGLEEELKNLKSIWDRTSQLTLTSVGMAIGHANFKKVTGDSSDLNIWIDET